MINIIILLLIFMFIFAVLGVTLFSPYDEKDFGNLGSTMYTLFILLTQDGWTDIYDFLYVWTNIYAIYNDILILKNILKKQLIIIINILNENKRMLVNPFLLQFISVYSLLLDLLFLLI